MLWILLVTFLEMLYARFHVDGEGIYGCQSAASAPYTSSTCYIHNVPGTKLRSKLLKREIPRSLFISFDTLAQVIVESLEARHFRKDRVHSRHSLVG